MPHTNCSIRSQSFNTAILSIDLERERENKANRLNCIILHLKATDEEIAMRFIIFSLLLGCYVALLLFLLHWIWFKIHFISTPQQAAWVTFHMQWAHAVSECEPIKRNWTIG